MCVALVTCTCFELWEPAPGLRIKCLARPSARARRGAGFARLEVFAKTTCRARTACLSGRALAAGRTCAGSGLEDATCLTNRAPEAGWGPAARRTPPQPA